jgi:hypothetical protein
MLSSYRNTRYLCNSGRCSSTRWPVPMPMRLTGWLLPHPATCGARGWSVTVSAWLGHDRHPAVAADCCPVRLIRHARVGHAPPARWRHARCGVRLSPYRYTAVRDQVDLSQSAPEPAHPRRYGGLGPASSRSATHQHQHAGRRSVQRPLTDSGLRWPTPACSCAPGMLAVLCQGYRCSGRPLCNAR